MKVGFYRFADHTVEIRSLQDAVHRLCADYAIPPQTAEIVIQTSNADVAHERAVYEQTYPAAHSQPEAELECLAVYRKLVRALLPYDVLLFHGSAVAVGGEAYLFIAPSGTGKSTHTRLWRELFGDRAVMVNDDKPLMHVSESGVTIYGTPWDGKHHLSRNIAVPLRAVCVLERAEENRIASVSPVQAFSSLLRQSYRYESEAEEQRALSLLDLLTQQVGLYRLGCNMTPAAAETAWRTMSDARKTNV